MKVKRNIDVFFILQKLQIFCEKKFKHERNVLEIQQITHFHLQPKNKCLRSQYCHIYYILYLNNKDCQFIELIEKILNQQVTNEAIKTIFKELKIKPFFFLKMQIKIYKSMNKFLDQIQMRKSKTINYSQSCLPNNQIKIINVSDLVTGIILMVNGQIGTNNIVKDERLCTFPFKFL
ncbi:unnamed protein product [Paramecium sonneborni]|uniref:Uncharacterized protein n=1 Tax=Paramecium sonneborni TaxID=65129 RepID=A0A8S1P0Q3_9CILI|nr:unnamed protein product [Paramecium sonneborni]